MVVCLTWFYKTTIESLQTTDEQKFLTFGSFINRQSTNVWQIFASFYWTIIEIYNKSSRLIKVIVSNWSIHIKQFCQKRTERSWNIPISKYFFDITSNSVICLLIPLIWWDIVYRFHLNNILIIIILISIDIDEF
jgi:hypothetical protein